MKCPSCGTPEKARIKVCQSCGEAFANEDMLAYHQLEYLVHETATWEATEKYRRPYIEKLKALRDRLRGTPAAEPQQVEQAAPAPVIEEPKVIPREFQPTVEPEPPKERVSFDQWLLSERNIKIALYSGGLLLVLAGLIFIGASWARIPGPAKFAITSLVTGLMYLGGYLLFQRKAYQIGGVALLGVASGFLILNFAVLQIYVLGPGGLRNEVMWLIALPPCLLLYVLTAYWTRSQLFTYSSIAAVISTLTAALVVIAAPVLVYFLTYAILSLVLLLAGRWFQTTSFEAFTATPLWIVAHVGMALVILASFDIDNAWLYTAPVGVIFYLLATYWLRTRLLAYVSIGAIFSMVSAIMTSLEAPLLVFTLVYSILMITFLGLGYSLRKTQSADFTLMPLQIGSHIGMGIVLISTLVSWVFGADGSDWLPILTFGFGTLFYILTDLFFQWLIVRWVSAFLFALTFTFTLSELDFSDSALGIALMLLSLAYLAIGYFLEQREGKRSKGWPLYGTAYLIAVFVTMFSVPDVDDLILVLFGDVILLGLSAAIHRDYKWIYGAAWLFMLPVYLTIDRFVSALHHQGLLMGILCLNYLIAGYLLGRGKLRLGGPFLTAAAFLSVVVVGLTMSNTLIATSVLTIIAVLYLLSALWLDWTPLLFPALVAVELLILTVNDMFFTDHSNTFEYSLVISYTVFGIVLVLGSLGLRRNNQKRWAWPLYVVGIFNLVVTYLAGFYYGGWLMVGLSLSLSILFLGFTWLERELLKQIKATSLLTYLGIGVIFIAHFYLLERIFPVSWGDVWPGYTAALCAVFVAIAWLLRNEPLTTAYSKPFRLSGILLIIIPLIGSIGILNPILAAVTFGIAGITYTVDAALRRILNLAYLGIGAFIVVIWAVLVELGVSETQAYAIPVGLTLLGVGWNERIHRGGLKYRIPTILGLFVLMGSAFIQSLPSDGFVYAIILLGESILAVFWGIRTRSRGYVQLGVIAIIANAFVQLGPGFSNLPRWVQIGLTGIILFGGGMSALFKREAILETRKKITEEWRSWES